VKRLMVCPAGGGQNTGIRVTGKPEVTVVTRWDEKAGLRRDGVGSQVIDVL